MLAILSLFGLALAATMIPDSDDPTPETGGAVDEERGAGTLGNDQHGDSVMSFASADSSADPHGDIADEDHGDDLLEDSTFFGTEEADVLLGTDGDDVLSGGAGEDVLHGNDGNDVLFGNDDDAPDTLNGGEGDDQIWLGKGDAASGGRGDDYFRMETDAAALISDYDPDDDRIEVIYDPSGPVPTLTADHTETGVTLRADGTLVAVFAGTKHFDVANVRLVAEAA